MFIGIGPESAVNAYLANVAHVQGDRFDARSSDFTAHPGAAPASPPFAQRFSGASSVGIVLLLLSGGGIYLAVNRNR